MNATFKSDLSGKFYPASERVSGRGVRPSLMAFIQRKHPEFSESSMMSMAELNQYRELFIAETLKAEMGQLSELENRVLRSMQEETILTEELDAEDPDKLTLGQRVADKVATFGGSWTFIISFGLFLLCWIVMNAFVLANRSFDPYPFILLNLILSCLAAIQAPIIMMSQNRQEEKDRSRAKKDYMINLKSELEIRNLHEKVDHLIMHQQQELLEIQRVQIEMMNDILLRISKGQTGQEKTGNA